MSDTVDELAAASPDTTDVKMRDGVYEALFGAGETAPKQESSPPPSRPARASRPGNRSAYQSNRFSLRFRDDAIETDYRTKIVPRVRKQLRESLSSSIPVWIVGGGVALAVLEDGSSLYYAVPGMVVFLIVLLVFERRASSMEALSFNGAISNTGAAVVSLSSAWVEGVFPQAGALMAIVATAFGFTLLNLPFLVSVAATLPYLLATAALLMSLPDIPIAGFQVFALFATYAVHASGAYARESAERRDFYLTGVIADQERDLEKERARRLGQYTLEGELGRGGMGVVHRARHAMLRRPTAVKILSLEDADADALARFEREVQLTSELSHPNIIAVYDYGRSPLGEFYYAMEYIDGLDLQTLVEGHGPLSPGRAADILAQIADGLHEAHARGLVHRDIKPANILLSRLGTRADAVKVLDFGLVREVEGSDSTPEGIAGTPAYIAPEIIRDPKNIGPANDVYAWGAVAFFLLTGRRAVQGSTLPELFAAHLEGSMPPPSQFSPHDCPEALDELVLSALALDPQTRPSAADLAERCRALGLHPSINLDRWWDELDGQREVLPVESAETQALTVMLEGR